MEKNNWKISTSCIHSGERNKKRQNRPIATPIEQTATYYWDKSTQIADFYNGKTEGIKYGRYGNNTQQVLEQKLAELEKAGKALVFSSGMNALTTVILSLVHKGEHLLYLNDCYRNTNKFFDQILPSLGIETTPVSFAEINNLEKYVKNNSVLFFSEIPTNPFLRVIDLRVVVDFCKSRNLITFIDSSFASPINLRPLEYGVDVIIHSATKYLGGHNDLFAGVIAGKRGIIDKVQDYRNVLGGMLGPMDSFLLLRSLKTLAVRMDRLNKSGIAVAKYLEQNVLVENVWYPGLNSHPDFEIAQEQMSGFGAVITFSVKSSEKKVSKFVDSLKLIYNASNFGGVESLIEQHAFLTFFKDREIAEKKGISGNLLRLSVGLEDVGDVINDLDAAFEVINNK